MQIPSETGRIRDYGPITGYMYNSSVYERFFYDPGYSLYSQPLNDSVPQLLSDLTGIPVNDLFINLEGGNIQFDGLKTGFGSQLLLEQNPSFNETTLCNQLKSYFRLNEFILLPVPENIGGADWHRTDMFMKVLDTETILISEYPDWVPDYGIIEGIADSLGLLMNGFGKPYHIIRIPAPVLADGTYANEPTDEVRSYTNALILNRKVIVPSYGTLSDSIAKAIYQEAMPGYEIVMVDSRSLSGSYGAIHTYTCQLPQSELLRFQHYRINGEQEFQPEMPISCYPQTNSMIDSLLVHYRVHPSQSFSTSRMFPACPGFIGTIPDLSPGDTVSYYLSMHTPGNQVTEPLPAPDAVYTFWFPAIQTDIRESFETNQTMKLYPNPNDGSFIVNWRLILSLEKLLNSLMLMEINV
ncbi:MAG: agmatine deiminase family protein [Bacteroidales bacterium]|nr:agmatine deiminase family protein [Bacteroidales bacterium]